MKDKPTKENKWNDLLSEVPYHYSNIVAMSVAPNEIRFAFLDQVPNGQRIPKAGIIMSHKKGRQFFKVLQDNIKYLDATSDDAGK